MYFEDFNPGCSFESKSRVVRPRDIRTFASLTGDTNHLHFDNNYAAMEGFKGRIAHGVLILSLGMGLWHSMNLTTETTIALLGLENLNFRSAIYPGDEIHLVSEAVSCRPSKSRPGAGIVTFKDKVKNQRGQVVMTCERKLMLKTRPPE